MNVLVTGVAGFIGSHLAERLLERGSRVVGLDSFDPYYDRAAKEANLAAIRPRATVVEGDILDEAALDRAFSAAPIDVVVHLAALAGVRPSLRQPARYQRVNVEGTALVAEAALRRGARRVVFASSSSVYGDAPGAAVEGDRADAPLSPYAASKRGAELVLASMAHACGLDVVALRYFTVYGPRQRPDMAVRAFARAIDRGEPLTLFGDGSSRDYTYIDDAVEGTLRAIDAPGAGFRVYNLGSGRPVELSALCALLGEALGREPELLRVPAPPGEVRATLASIEAARRDLGYRPATPIDDGIRRFVDWYRREPR
ncbi:MAG TPA: SDR family NAD(P)-dependent oxidoreductase [Candidatus Nanopelagicales bacterium]|nr:SDR family NAD(P)-dependent oxidoreductase [Candidatus Nanopelagicales bacterium]